VSRATGVHNSPAQFERFQKLHDEHILIIPMIETQKAIENIDELLASFPECPVFAVGAEDLRKDLNLPFDDEGTKDLVKIVRALAKKIRDSGKWNMIPLRGPYKGRSVESLADEVEFYFNDFPYVVDSVCLMYGVMNAFEIRDLARQRGEVPPDRG
jgi:2-keto-3-deoxy-L-rhamnonate aldolase RhmA